MAQGKALSSDRSGSESRKIDTGQSIRDGQKTQRRLLNCATYNEPNETNEKAKDENVRRSQGSFGYN